MDQKILQNESPAARLQALKDSAEKREVITYPKQLGEEHFGNLKDELTADSIQLVKLEEALAEYKVGHKARTKPLKQKVAIALTKLRNGVEEVEEEVFLLADQEEGMMGYYNAQGHLIRTRPLLPEERQFRIVDNSKNASNY